MDHRINTTRQAAVRYCVRRTSKCPSSVTADRSIPELISIMFASSVEIDASCVWLSMKLVNSGSYDILPYMVGELTTDIAWVHPAYQS